MDLMDYRRKIIASSPHLMSASGAVATFSDGADLPLKSLIVDIEPVQSGTGDPSPTNIRPISGWTGCNIQRDGKNLLALPVVKFNEVDATIANCFFIKAGTYRISFDVSVTNRIGVRMLDLNGDIYSDPEHRPVNGWTYNSNTKSYYQGADSSQTHREVTLTIVQDCYIRIVSNLTGGGLTNVQLELGSTVTPYEPYKGRTIPINWQTEAGTVYGGKLDVLSGVMRVDRAMVTFDGSEGWAPQNGVFTLYLGDAANIYKAGTTSQQNIVIADRFKPNGIKYRDGCGDGNIIKVVGNNTQIACYSSVYSSVDAFKSSLDDNPMQIVYVLATTIEIQLDAHTVKSLLGANNIFANTGDTSVEYRADTTLYIQRLTEPDADMIADANIVSGQYFMVGNSLFKATANIASGSAVIVGTNCIRKSLSEALNQINA